MGNETKTDTIINIKHIKKDAKTALEGRRIRAVLLNKNKPEAEELAAAFDTEGIKATADRFPKEYDQYTYILIPENEPGEVSPLIIKAGKVISWNTKNEKQD